MGEGLKERMRSYVNSVSVICARSVGGVLVKEENKND